MIVDNPIAQGTHERPPGLRVLGQSVVEESPRTTIEAGRHRAPAGYQQLIAGNDECSLRRDAGVCRRIVWLQHVHGSAAVVGPEDLPGFRIERMDEHAHKGPDARGKVEDPVLENRPSPSGPGADEPAVPQDLSVRRPSPELPDQRSSLPVHTVEISIVTDEVDLPVGGHSR